LMMGDGLWVKVMKPVWYIVKRVTVKRFSRPTT